MTEDNDLEENQAKDLLWDVRRNLKEAKIAIHEETAKLGEVMTGEHVVGRIRVPDIDIFPDEQEIQLMPGIKKVFDPNGILDPRCAIRTE